MFAGMNYSVRRRAHTFWCWYAGEARAGTPVALQELVERPDGAEAVTSHLGLDQLRHYLEPLGFPTVRTWPITVTASTD